MTTYPEPDQFPPGAGFVDGVWAEVLTSTNTSGRAALFLDRDGVLCEEVNYLHKVEDVALSKGAVELIKAANDANVPVVVVTNQAGIAYGTFGWNAFVEVQGEILARVNAGGGKIDAVFACPFHEKGKPPYGHPNHPARKPAPGMLLLAEQRLGIDLARSWIIGDRAIDMEAGKNAAIKGGFHVLSGHGSGDGEGAAALALATADFEVRTADGIGGCTDIISLLA